MGDEAKTTRRELLRTGLIMGAATLVSPHWLWAEERQVTPNLVLGPFYPAVKPLERDADLTMLAGHKERAKGQVIYLAGRVLNRQGEPVSGARLELWQANAAGRYNHPSDPNRAPLDPNFQGYAEQATDAQGRFHFKTIKPGPYPMQDGTAMRAPHIHFDVFGRTDRKVTQMFFAGDPRNEQDPLYQQIRDNKEGAVARITPHAGGVEPDAWLVEWDIVLPQG